jgi:hypothetical protein
MSTSPKPFAVINDVDLIVKPSYWAMPVAIWAGLAGLIRKRHPEIRWSQAILAGGVGSLVISVSDAGHAIAHTVSARMAEAPMDRIILIFGMPRTLYDNNDVPPRAHIIRSLGGPVFNAIGLGLGLLWRATTKPDTPSRDLANIACAINGGLASASFVPLPIIDGGVILKWGLVERGASESEADYTVHVIDIALASLLTILGLVALIIGRRRVGIGLLAGAAIVTAIDVGVIQ